MPDLQTIGAGASVIAMVVAIFIAVWTVSRDLRDKGRLSIKCGHVFDSKLLKRGDAKDPIITYVKLTNVGRRPLTVSGMEFAMKNQNGVCLSWVYKNLPCLLQPSESVFEPLSYDFERSPTTHIVVTDSEGKKWRSARKEVKTLLNRPIFQPADIIEPEQPEALSAA